MKWNAKVPKMEVDAEAQKIVADGELMDCAAAEKLPLGRWYNLF